MNNTTTQLRDGARMVFDGCPLPAIEQMLPDLSEVQELKAKADVHLAVISHQVTADLVTDETRKDEMLTSFARSARSDISNVFEISPREQDVLLGRFFDYAFSRYGTGNEEEILSETELGRTTTAMCIDYHNAAQHVLNQRGVSNTDRMPVNVYADPRKIIVNGLFTGIAAMYAVMREIYKSTPVGASDRLEIINKSRASALRLARLPLHITLQQSESVFDSQSGKVDIHSGGEAMLDTANASSLEVVRLAGAGCMGLVKFPTEDGTQRSAVTMLYDHLSGLIAETKIHELDYLPAKGELLPPFISAMKSS